MTTKMSSIHNNVYQIITVVKLCSITFAPSVANTYLVIIRNYTHTCIYALEKRLVHSETQIIMEEPCMWPPTPLIVISPNHGHVLYAWEKKKENTENWESVNVPSHTCILYIDTAMQYRCNVNGKSVLFNVQGSYIASLLM